MTMIDLPKIAEDVAAAESWLDSLEPKVAEGHQFSVPLAHARCEKLGKVFVTPDTKLALQTIAARHFDMGASGVAALLVEELCASGQIEQVWKAHKNRRRRTIIERRRRGVDIYSAGGADKRGS